MKDRHILEGTGALEQPLDDDGGLADCLDALRGHLANHPGRQCRPRERDALEQLVRKPESLADLSNAILAQLNQRLDDAVAESLLRVDPELLQDVMLPLDSGDGLIHIGQDRSLEKVLCSAFLDDAPEYISVEGLRNGLALLFRVHDSLERREELLARLDYFNRNAELAEETRDLFGLSLTHEAVFDEDGLQALAQGSMPEHRDRRRIDASR